MQGPLIQASPPIYLNTNLEDTSLGQDMSHSFLGFSGKTCENGARLYQSIYSYSWELENAVSLATHFI